MRRAALRYAVGPRRDPQEQSQQCAARRQRHQSRVRRLRSPLPPPPHLAATQPRDPGASPRGDRPQRPVCFQNCGGAGRARWSGTAPTTPRRQRPCALADGLARRLPRAEARPRNDSGQVPGPARRQGPGLLRGRAAGAARRAAPWRWSGSSWRDVGLVFGTRQAVRKPGPGHRSALLPVRRHGPARHRPRRGAVVDQLNTGLQFVLGGVVLARGGAVSSYLPAVLAADATVDALCGGVVCTTLLSGADYSSTSAASWRTARRRGPRGAATASGRSRGATGADLRFFCRRNPSFGTSA